MTLILGMNLTDSVYLAADTRVTQMKGSVVVGIHDDLLKIWGNKHGIFCAVAGDAGLARHLLSGLRYESFARRGVESIRKNIEQFVYDHADAYWKKKGQTTEATLMFAGSSQHSRASVKRSLVKPLVEAHLSNKEARSEISQKLLLYEKIANGGVEEYRTNILKTDLFAVQVSSHGVTITDTVPGQHLMYGSPGLVKEDIELKDVARIEFGNSDNTPVLMTAHINGMREKRKLEGVGNTVVPIQIQPDGTSILVTGTTYAVRMDNQDKPVVDEISSLSVDAKTGTFYRQTKGNKYPLTPIENYETNDSDGMSLLLL